MNIFLTLTIYFMFYELNKPIPVAALCKAWVCVGLITRPEECYRVWCVWVWSWSRGNEETLDR